MVREPRSPGCFDLRLVGWELDVTEDLGQFSDCESLIVRDVLASFAQTLLIRHASTVLADVALGLIAARRHLAPISLVIANTIVKYNL